jgi:hypothetical protein
MSSTSPWPATTEPLVSAINDRAWRTLIPVAAATLAALAFTLDGYNFGRSNQIEQLVAVMSVQNEGFLAHDPFIKFFVEGGPRFYYTRLLALGSHVAPLPALFFLLTLASNAATFLITFRTTLHAFGSLVAAYASLLLLAALQFYVRLGEAGFLLTDFLTPASLAIPGSLAALSAAARADSSRAMLWAAATVVIHPLYGLAAGSFVMLLDAVRILGSDAPGHVRRQYWLGCMARGLGFAAVILLLWYRPDASPRLDDATFFNIYARTRVPHHVLPSRFPLKHWAFFAIFTTYSLVCLYVVRERIRALAPLLWAAALVSVGFVLGYVFVELIPIRAVLSLHAYRFTCFTSWVGIVVGAGALGSVFEPGLHERLAVRRAVAVGLALLLLVLAERVMAPRHHALTLLSVLIITLGAWAVHVSWHRYTALGATVVALAVVAGSRFVALGQRERWLGNRLPSFTVSDFSTPYDDVAAYVREHTPRDAVFLIADVASHWEAGAFRYKAERALFLDYKLFPFGDAEMAEWYERMSLLRSLDTGQNNDPQLLAIAARYGVGYGVLPKASPTDLPVVFVGDRYRLVSFGAPESLPD